MIIETENLTKRFGRHDAVRGLNLSVPEGATLALIGANGAGKTTTLKAVSGILHPRAGEIRLGGESLAHIAPHDISSLGVMQVPEGRRIFARLTVDENLQMGAFARRDRRAVAEDRARVLELFPRLHERLKQVAGTLSGGEQQMVATARALMARPRVLLMDEPSMGLSPVMVEHVFETIRTINQQGVTILLVEQNALLALSIADRAYVLESGRVVLSGRGPELIDDEKVQRAYLG